MFRFSVFAWTGKNDSKTLCVDANLLKTEKINSFSKENGYLWTGPDSVMRVDYNYKCRLLTPDSTLLILKY